MMDAIDLETAIADLRNLSFICHEMADAKLKQTRGARETEGFTNIMLSECELNSLLFLIGEVECRARNLDKAFHAALPAPV